MPRKAKNHEGVRYGKLTVLKRVGSRNKSVEWLCVCDCGKEVIKLSAHLKGDCSCGCGRVKHGHTEIDYKSRTYNSWDSMKQRCLRPSYHGYHRYGGRGITICDRWLNSFENFLDDMGERPEGKTLDRINVNGNYCKENCRWATPKEQQNNRRINNLYKVEKHGRGNIKAKIVADSINGNNRITTFELEYPRFIHSELMTHRLFSRNAMSSRAVPIGKMLEQVRKNPARPIHWGINKSGMQAETEHEDVELCENLWGGCAQSVAMLAEVLKHQGLHKQIVNRLLEPFQMMKVVVTATEYNNFFWLRCDEDAQPEIKELAECMKSAYDESKPEQLKTGEWHTPYVEHKRYPEGLIYKVYGISVNVKDAIAISSSCCAQVSYRSIDNSFDKAMRVYDRLGVGGSKIHASPFEHVASPMVVTKWKEYCDPSIWVDAEEDGVTHVDREGNYWSGNLKGWIQHRQLLDGHTKW